LIQFIQEIYSPHYTGNIGVDMLVYLSGNQYKLHPCIEINMRKSMGFLAIRLFENYISPTSQGELFVDYCPGAGEIYEKHREWQRRYPVVMERGKVKEGYVGLCPVEEGNGYWAGISVR
jgi:hypothetical protein